MRRQARQKALRGAAGSVGLLLAALLCASCATTTPRVPATDGTITEFALDAGTRGAGLSAGSDRQPPTHLVDRLYVADSGNNRIAYLQFRP
jgi:hypothetical protein